MQVSIWHRIAPFILPVMLVSAWEAAYHYSLLPTSQFASPSSIVATLVDLTISGALPQNAFFSLLRLVAGVCIGSFVGVLVGILLALVPAGTRGVAPTISFFAGIPVVVWLPLWIAFVGTGEAFRTGLVAIATFFLIYTVSFIATKRSQRNFFEIAEILEMNLANRIQSIYIPASLEQIFVSIRISLAFGWVILFFVEYAVSRPGSEGIGWFVANARSVGRIEDEFAGLVALGLIAFIVDWVTARIQRSSLKWSDTVE